MVKRRYLQKNKNKELKGLCLAVIEQALFDALLFKNPRSHHDLNFIRYKEEDPEHISREARDFINAENKSFEIYCKILVVDPELTEKMLWDRIKKFDND